MKNVVNLMNVANVKPTFAPACRDLAGRKATAGENVANVCNVVNVHNEINVVNVKKLLLERKTH